MNKPRRQCIFCENPVNSKEHIWSRWMHDLLEGKPTDKYDRQTLTRSPDGTEEMTGPTGKPGNVLTIQVRAVCRECNHGWMNTKEQEVRPFLEPMIKGDPVSISPQQMELLAQWCAQKFIVMEHAARDTSLTPFADRRALKEEGKIPSYFKIYVGNHLSKSRSGSIRHSHTLALSPKGPVPPLDGTSRNIQTISLIMGRLFVHLNAARIDNFTIEKVYFISRIWNECRIWPDANSTLYWPHRPAPDNEGLFKISNALAAIGESPKVFWIDNPAG